MRFSFIQTMNLSCCRICLPPPFRLRSDGWIGMTLFCLFVVAAIIIELGAWFFCEVRAANVRLCFDFNRHPPLVVHLSPIATRVASLDSR